MASNFKKYYYYLETRLLNMDDSSTYDLDNNVIKLLWVNDYGKNVFPILRLTLMLSKSEYLMIRDHDVRMKLTLRKSSLSEDADEDNTTMNSELAVFENVIFELIDKNFITYDDTRVDDDSDASMQITYSLFSVEHLKVNKQLINGNYLDCRPIDVLSFIDKSGNSNILMEIPDNDNVYEQITVPPINATVLPEYIENVYGLYKDSLRVFYDFDCWYIMDSELKNATPTALNDYNKVILDLVRNQDLNTQYPFDYGYKSKISDYYYIKINARKFKLIDKDRARDEILGSHKIVLQRDGNLDTKVLEFDTDDKIVAKTKVYRDPIEDIFVEENANSRENKAQAIFTFSNLDYDAFKVNKRIFADFQNKKYEFKVDNLVMEFVRDTSSGGVTLKGTVILEEN